MFSQDGRPRKTAKERPWLLVHFAFIEQDVIAGLKHPDMTFKRIRIESVVGGDLKVEKTDPDYIVEMTDVVARLTTVLTEKRLEVLDSCPDAAGLRRDLNTWQTMVAAEVDGRWLALALPVWFREAIPYRAFIQKALLPRAERYLEEDNFEQAYLNYRILYDRGIRTAPVAYGMAKSRLGDFAFGASPAELKEAEFAYMEAARLDPTYAAPHKGLGELYEDTDRYEDAAKAYSKYLKLKPTAEDRKRIERKIKVMERKASR